MGGLRCVGLEQGRHQPLPQLEARHEIAVSAHDDVGAAAGHVGGDGHGAHAACLGHDFRFALHKFGLGIEQLVGDAALEQQLTEQLGFLHAGGAHQHRAALLVDGEYFIGHGIPLGLLGAENLVIPIVAAAGAVRGHRDHIEAVGVAEFFRFCFAGAGHAGEAFIEAEVVLIGDGGEGFGFVLNRHALFGFQGLVLAIAPAPAGHHTAGALIHDHHLLIAHDVIDIAHKQLLSAEGVEDEVGPGVLRVEQILHAEQGFGIGIALIGEAAAPLLFIHFVVAFSFVAVVVGLLAAHELGRNGCRLHKLLLRAFHLAGDD